MTIEPLLYVTSALLTICFWFTLAGGLMAWLVLWALWSGRRF
jgi:hypothetical protein